LVKKIKPNFRKLGKQYGPKMKDITAAVAQLGQEEIRELEREQQLKLALKDESVVLTPEDVEITSEDIPGWSVASEGDITVALDITITDELKKEGMARDLVNRVQNLRKDMGMDVQDKIRISIEKAIPLFNEAVEANRQYICNETQALSLDMEEHLDGDSKTLEIDNLLIKIKIGVNK
jgi:isoleucyl-tRNA synthetase